MSKDIQKPIVLIGTGGAGKTTTGELLAQRMDKLFFDVDRIIEQRQGRTIVDIFTAEGEPYFREVEQKTTIELIQNNPKAVISVGGGAFMNKETRTYIKENAVSVFLKADLALLLKRVGNGEGRPLLKNNPSETLQKLIENRYPIYEQADFVIECRDESVEETVSRVLAVFDE